MGENSIQYSFVSLDLILEVGEVGLLVHHLRDSGDLDAFAKKLGGLEQLLPLLLVAKARVQRGEDRESAAEFAGLGAKVCRGVRGELTTKRQGVVEAPIFAEARNRVPDVVERCPVEGV